MAGESILIIEDDPTMLRGLKDIFAFEGYSVRAEKDGEKGLQAAVESGPDLTIREIAYRFEMPDAD